MRHSWLRVLTSQASSCTSRREEELHHEHTQHDAYTRSAHGARGTRRMDVLQTSLLLCLVGGSLHLNEVAGYDWGVWYEKLEVTATEGRDVDLPCSFWFPSWQGPVARFRWTRDGTGVTADNLVYSSTSTEVAKSYKSRTSLSDNLSNKICTLKINNVRVSDVATYFFTFETNTREFTGTAGVQLRVKCARFNDAAVSYGPSAEVRVQEGGRALLPCAFCFRIYNSVRGFWLIKDRYDETTTGNIVYNLDSGASLIDWYKGRVALVGSLSLGSCSLEIRDAMRGDSNTYFFRANIDGTKFSGTAGIKVKVVDRSLTPKTEGSKRIRENVGTRANLKCTTTRSQQADNFKWWKYRSDGGYETLSETRSDLTFEAVAVKDVGWYECEAWSSSANSEISWTELQVLSFLPASPGLRAAVPATLACIVHTVSRMDSVTIRWVLDDDVKLTNSTSQGPSPDGTFIVTSWLSFTPSPEDDGKRWRCEASGGDVASTTVQDFILDVKYAPVNTTVHSATRLPRVESGDNVTMTCVAHGNPSLTSFSWSRVPPSGRQLPHNPTGGILILMNVTAEDSGRYLCEASNSEGPGTSAHLDLDVQYAPVVVNVSQDETCGGEGDVCLFCEVKANPSAAITWWAWGSDVPEWTQDGKETLTWSSVVIKKSQEKNVTCAAANVVGETKAVFYIQELVSASWAMHVAAGVGVTLLLLLLSALCWRGRVLAAVMKWNEAEPATLFQLGDRMGPDGGAMGGRPRADGSAGDRASSQQPLYCNVRRELGPPHPRIHLPGGSAGPAAPTADCLYSLVGMAAQAEHTQAGTLYSVVNRKRAPPGPTCGEATLYSTVGPTGAGNQRGPSATPSAGDGSSGDADEQTEALVYASLDFGATSGLP
ncbi:unnamed protein product [Lampetra fluviatilis]